MQNLTRNTILLLASLLVVPGASAQGVVDLDATANAALKADASGAVAAAESVKAQAEAAKAELEGTADGIRADAQARADATLSQAEAHAQASADTGMSFGARALAEIQGAFESVKELASSLFASAHVEADVTSGIDG